MDGYLGVYIGLKTNKCVIVTGVGEFIAYNYQYIQGKPVSAERQGHGRFRDNFPLISASIVSVSRYGPLYGGLYFG